MSFPTIATVAVNVGRGFRSAIKMEHLEGSVADLCVSHKVKFLEREIPSGRFFLSCLGVEVIKR